MKQKVLSLIFAELILVSAFVKTVSAQTFSLEIKCKNLPQNTVILGEVKGDKFTPLDSLNTKSNSLKFNVKESLHPGIYRVIFGQTLYAKIMNETPQQLDFIFNNEDIILETDFNAPEDSLLIILSEENRVWFEFQKNEKKLQNEMDELKMEIDYYQQAGTLEKATEQIQKYNEIQTERSQLIQNTIEKNSNLWAARLIAIFSRAISRWKSDGKSTERNFSERIAKND